MLDFLDEIEATLKCGIYSTALLSAMVVPDACGAVEFPIGLDGKKSKNRFRYQSWYNKYGRVYKSPFFTFDGDVLWQIRNGMMHETKLNLQKYGFDRVLFTTPRNSGGMMHMNVLRNNGGVQESALNVDLTKFCMDMIVSCKNWIGDISSDASKSAMLDQLIQFRGNGLAPHIVGYPLVA